MGNSLFVDMFRLFIQNGAMVLSGIMGVFAVILFFEMFRWMIKNDFSRRWLLVVGIIAGTSLWSWFEGSYVFGTFLGVVAVMLAMVYSVMNGVGKANVPS
ncbi:MAG TPA: hypothetical protein VEC17_03035 [Candidatus Binatia bacterium]|nr:hypothetical protein [Candidatus Binatia bacterium]